ncbi:amidohydrolase family protein [Pseudomonas sp. P66]|uniref:Amidohydrolase family protein n=1 Tax=Pseudomonas arcuscaelestis TaxID=2710591 RepID=A0ABS2BZU8_9PSED|nr:amidohydrolase family protein [Pseudomonas arcuscaelestis]MBM3112826.1 amidohydrolase family protein [Pseudomonas arcuscaelestis]MBM5459146.1 amidohydrolase family protein [Pseudomonas arcuscaelestis]
MRSKQKQHLSLSSIALIAGVVGCGQALAATVDSGKNTVYLNGEIYTQNRQHQKVEAIAVADDKFVYAGNREGAESFIKQGFQVVDLGGKMVLPGLHDNHIHVLGTVALDVCDLQGKAVNLDQLASKVKECLPRYASEPGAWLKIDQWVPYEGNEPTAQYKTILAALDAAADGHPIILSGVDGHASAYNSKALSMAEDEQGNSIGFNPKTLGKGGVFAELAPYVSLDTGVVRDAAKEKIPVGNFDMFAQKPGDPRGEKIYGDILPDVAKVMAQSGITSIQDACSNDFIREQLVKMQTQNLLNMRVTAATCFIDDDYKGKVDIAGHLKKAQEVRAAFADNPLIKADAVKIFADGVLEGDSFSNPPFSPNAGMLHTYQTPHLKLNEDTGAITVSADSEDSKNNGIVNYRDEDFKNYASALDADGFAIHVHSIGDRATRVALDALEAARQRNGNSHIPHTLAHLQVIHPDDQRRLGELGVFLTYTYAWINQQPEYDVLITPFLEKSKKGQDINDLLYNKNNYTWNATYPVQSSYKAGAVLVAGSDAPVDSRDPRPFMNIAAGITRAIPGEPAYNAEQSATLEQMLDAYTINGARAVRQDKIIGSIEPGKSADFIVLDRNLFSLVEQGKPEQIADTKVVQTVFRGQTIYTN